MHESEGLKRPFVIREYFQMSQAAEIDLKEQALFGAEAKEMTYEMTNNAAMSHQ